MRHSPKLFDEIVSLFSASCPFGKLSVRQNARSANCPFGKTSVRQTAVLSGYITTLKNKQKLDVSSEGPSSRVSSLRSKRRVSAYF